MHPRLAPVLVPLALIGGLLAGGTAPAGATTPKPEPVRLSASSVPEDAPVGSVIGRLSAGRGASDFRLVDGRGSRDNGLVGIAGRRLLVAEPLDHETARVLRVRVRATTDEGHKRVGRLRIAVRDVADQAPSDLDVSASSVAENEPAGTVVGTLGAVGATSFTLLPGAGDDGAFAVSGDQLRTARPLDHEERAAYVVRVQARSASGATTERDLTITVSDANDAPTAVLLAPEPVNELTAPVLAGRLSAVDQDAGDTFTYALVGGTDARDNDSFEIRGDELWVVEPLDHEARAVSIRVRATDAAGATYDQVMTVDVRDRNEAPYGLSVSPPSVPENAPSGTRVGQVSAVDPDGDALTYELVGRAPCRACRVPVGPFELSPTGELTTTRTFDHESTPSFTVRVRATDRFGSSTEADLTVEVTNVNEAPTGLTRTNTRYAYWDDVTGYVFDTVVATDPDGDELTYSLVEPSSQLAVAADGAMTLVARGTYGLRQLQVRATDPGGLSTTATITVQVMPYSCGEPRRPGRC